MDFLLFSNRTIVARMPSKQPKAGTVSAYGKTILLMSLGWILSLSHWAWGAETQIQLLSEKSVVASGGKATVGILFKLKEGWHTYWRNGGDAAQPPSVQWDLPTGVTASSIQWPIPTKEVDKNTGLTSYTYHDLCLLMVELHFDPNLPPGPLTLNAEVRWLECRESCVPRQGKVATELLIGTQDKTSEHASLIEEWQKRVAERRDDLPIRVDWADKIAEDERLIRMEINPESGWRWVDFYPFENESYEVGGQSTLHGEVDEAPALEKKILNWEESWPVALSGLALMTDGQGGQIVHETTLVLGDGFPEGLAGSSNQAPGPEPKDPPAPAKSLGLMLGFAFLGGLILNLMPCVLPVISLKILGFVQQSDKQPARVLQMGLFYGLGVLISFWLLAAGVIALQFSGLSTNWGMQFQQTQFLVLMTILMTLVALNFFGVFEVSAGAVTGAASAASSGSGRLGAFANGVLATILATPCTAPFLGTALGFAFSQPPQGVLLMFSTIALGLALPYVLLSWQPAWMRWLPRPGAWMNHFKVFMGFPMLATVIWLYAIARKHFGPNGDLWLGLLLVATALLAWIYGTFIQGNSRYRGLAWGALLIGAVACYGWIMEHELDWRHSSVSADPQKNSLGKVMGKFGIEWLPWSEQAVMDAQRSGKTVLVDFTAAWCMNCQVNKKTSIEIESVREKLESIQGITLRGDYTFSDERITQKLKDHGRAGVPLVLIYPPEEGAAPELLPELLTPRIVLEALERAAGSLGAKP